RPVSSWRLSGAATSFRARKASSWSASRQRGWQALVTDDGPVENVSGSPPHQVAFLVLQLLPKTIVTGGARGHFALQLGIQVLGVLDAAHLVEVQRVGDAQRTHPVGVF